VSFRLIEPGAVGPESLAEYRARGGYEGLGRVLASCGAAGELSRAAGAFVLAELRRAGLRGRGGSGEGRPAWEKWSRVARAPGETKYVVANGAESSPVSQKDRYLMSRFPHRVIEGLLAACLATGAPEAYLYVRGDSEESTTALTGALGEARAAGVFGPGTALPVSIELQPSLPGYISGEETAVLDALEGLEGLPQPKPPRPEEIGLRGCPTLVANVETLAAAAGILRSGAEAFRAAGTPDCPGTALFTVSGDVERPGVYELPYGTPLAELLQAAGAPDREEILTVLPGGLSSGPLRPDELDVPLTYEDLAAVGSSVGPAAVVVFARSEAADLAKVVAENAWFLTQASCGQCKGCKEGSQALAGALASGDAAEAADRAKVLLYGRGNCGHPTGAARFALRALQAFPEAWASR
jgi:NADH-quinone oxidoreductase subunit F